MKKRSGLPFNKRAADDSLIGYCATPSSSKVIKPEDIDDLIHSTFAGYKPTIVPPWAPGGWTKPEKKETLYVDWYGSLVTTPIPAPSYSPPGIPDPDWILPYLGEQPKRKRRGLPRPDLTGKIEGISDKDGVILWYEGSRKQIKLIGKTMPNGAHSLCIEDDLGPECESLNRREKERRMKVIEAAFEQRAKGAI